MNKAGLASKFWRAYRALAIPLAVVLIVLSAAVPAYAYLYSVPIGVLETDGSEHENLCVTVEMPVEWMIEQGFITRSDALDTRVETLSGVQQEHSVADDRILLFLPSLEAYTQINRLFTAGNTALPSLNIMIGHSGHVTAADASALELGAQFTWTIRAFVDVAAGSNKNLVYKEDAFRIYVNAAGSIRAAILDTGDVEDLAVTATGLTSELFTIVVDSDGTDFSITVDGQEKDTTSLGANSVPDNANTWYFFQNNSTPYIEYLKLEN
jgi:hypothetical protein